MDDAETKKPSENDKILDFEQYDKIRDQVVPNTPKEEPTDLDFAKNFIGKSTQEQDELIGGEDIDTRSDVQKDRDKKRAEYGSSSKTPTFNPLMVQNIRAQVVNPKRADNFDSEFLYPANAPERAKPKHKPSAKTPISDIRPEYDPKLNPTTLLSDEKKSEMRSNLDTIMVNHKNDLRRINLKRLMQKRSPQQIRQEKVG